MDVLDKKSADMIIDLFRKVSSGLGDRFYDLDGLSIYSGIGKACLRQHIEKDGLRAYLPGGKILVKKSDFDEWVGRYRYQKQSKKKRSQKDLDELVDDVVDKVKLAKLDD